MSQLYVDNIKGRTGGAVGFPTGMVVTGVSTFNNAVSIAGTLTYDDVTNIDSVGIITARSGINVSAGGINAVGVVTATSFVGSGASLTDVISGVELKFGGNSVGTAVTSINFVGFSSITAPSSGLSTVTAPSVAKSSAIANFIGG